MRVLTVLLLLGAGLASADTLLIKSADGGRTWTDIDPGPPHQLLDWLSVDPGTSILYALHRRDLGAEAQLLVSADGGRTWQVRQNFRRDVSWSIRPAGPVSPGMLYLAYREPGVPLPRSVVIARVVDGGQTMEQYRAQGLTIEQPPAGIGSTYASLVGLDVNPAAPSTLYALITNEYADDIYAFFQALWRSEDGGRNWRRLEPPVSPDCDYPQIWIAASDSSLYLSCGPSEFLRSTDGGESWARKATPDGVRIHIRENLTRESAPLLFHASDFRPISANAPARRGEPVTLFAFGLGELEPSLAAGELPPAPPPQLSNAPCVVFSERPGSVPLAAAPSQWAGAAPGLIGVYQVNLEVPAFISPGSYALSLTERRLGDVFSRECKVGYQGNPLDWFTLDVQ